MNTKIILDKYLILSIKHFKHFQKRMEITRSCIYPKDVQRITGKSEKSSRKLLQRIKKELNKEPHQFITTKEFSKHTGIDLETIKAYLTD
jgi:hypothetical protein